MSLYPVLDAYATVQGEGYRTAGEPIFLIRFGTLDEWVNAHLRTTRPTPYTLVEGSELVEKALAASPRTVHFTGDEPMLTDIGPLVRLFEKESFRISLDTCGAFVTPISVGAFYHLSVGPKPGLPLIPNNLLYAHEVRFYVKANDPSFTTCLDETLGVMEAVGRALVIPFSLSKGDIAAAMEVAMERSLRFHIPTFRAIPDFDAHMNGGEICKICLINDGEVTAKGTAMVIPPTSKVGAVATGGRAGRVRK